MSSTQPVRPLAGELGRLELAVNPARDVSRREPWELTLRDREVGIRLTRLSGGGARDVDGGLLSCGCALANLELALRALGYESTIDIPESGLVGAVIRVGGFSCPTLTELALRRAAGWRPAYDGYFRFLSCFGSFKQAVIDSATVFGVLTGEDSRGIPPGTSETVLVLSTTLDTRRARIQAGYALERAWLTAIGLGLAGSAVTSPSHLKELRGSVPGRIQAIFRFGCPAAPASTSRESHRDRRNLQQARRRSGGRLGCSPARGMLGR